MSAKTNARLPLYGFAVCAPGLTSVNATRPQASFMGMAESF
jgi:hypothetical protein